MQFIRNVLNEQRRRLTGSLMAYLEENVYGQLTPQQQKELRGKVLASVQQYHDVCLDMLKASVDDGMVINEEAVQLLARMVSSQVRRDLAGTDGHR